EKILLGLIWVDTVQKLGSRQHTASTPSLRRKGLCDLRHHVNLEGLAVEITFELVGYFRARVGRHMHHDHETALAVWLPVGNSDCMRSALYQEVRIELPRLIGLFFGSHGNRIKSWQLTLSAFITGPIGLKTLPPDAPA